MIRRGDGSWCLSDVAAGTGMSPAALVKRFGSKSGLLTAVTSRWAENLPAYRSSPAVDPRDAIVEWVHTWIGGVTTPGPVLGHLTLLFEEIVDPRTRPQLMAGWRRQESYLDDAIKDAATRGLWTTAPPAGTAQAWLDLLSGAVLRGAVTDPGPGLDRAARVIVRQIREWSGRWVNAAGPAWCSSEPASTA